MSSDEFKIGRGVLRHENAVKKLPDTNKSKQNEYKRNRRRKTVDRTVPLHSIPTKLAPHECLQF